MDVFTLPSLSVHATAGAAHTISCAVEPVRDYQAHHQLAIASVVVTVVAASRVGRSKKQRRKTKVSLHWSRRGGGSVRDTAAVAVRAATVADECEVLQLEQSDLCTVGDEDADRIAASKAASLDDLDAEFKPPTALDLTQRAIRYYTQCTSLLLSYVPVFVKSKLGEGSETAAQVDDEMEKEWSAMHEEGAVSLANLIYELKGFYVKIGQVIATRSDLFPAEYSRKCANMVDSVNPLPFPVIKRVVEDELLGGLPLEDAFESFDEVPLGSASIAQVHRATLRGGREVAVKVQRPNVEPQLMSDVSVIKNFSLLTRELFPVDYYLVTRELEEQLQDEFDFETEANGMDRIADALQRGGRRAAVTVPRSVPGFISKKVLCMDFIRGAPLSQLKEELKRRGIEIEPGSIEEQLFGKKLLQSLTDAFAVMVFEEGFFHADPHPGNIFIQPDGSVSLIDFGQTKSINYKFRKQCAELMVFISDYNILAAQQGPGAKEKANDSLKLLGDHAKSMGVVFLPSAGEYCAGALALWLFDSSRKELPEDYEANELSPNCPVRDVSTFPREFVLLCRMTLLIRGLAMRLNIGWSLADAWRDPSLKLLEGKLNPKKASSAAEISPRIAEKLFTWWARLKSSRKAKQDG